MNASNTSMTTTLALLDRMKGELPEIWGKAQVVGNWVWLEFNVPPLKQIRSKLKELGFHWNHERKCWQHPCGLHKGRSTRDPRSVYPVIPPSALEMKEIAPHPRAISAKEFKIGAFRD